MQIIFFPFLWSSVGTNPWLYITASLFLTLIILEERSVMVHITLCDTEIATSLNQEKKYVMMAGSMVDGYGFQNLKKSRIGEPEREKCVENSHWPTSEVVEIIISCRSKRSRSVDARKGIMFFCTYLPSKVRECIETRCTRTLTMKDVDFSIFTGKAREHHSVPINTDFSQHDCLERKHII